MSLVNGKQGQKEGEAMNREMGVSIPFLQVFVFNIDIIQPHPNPVTQPMSPHFWKLLPLAPLDFAFVVIGTSVLLS